MSIGITIAWLSSLCLALMIIFDRLMVGDCYRNRPNQAWLVSSVGGMVFGLLATGVVWVYMSLTSQHTLHALFNTTIELMYPYGLLMLIAGIMAMQVLYHYFHAFIPEDGREVNETAIAMWLASSPIWIFVTVALLQYFNLPLGLFVGLGKAEVSWSFGLLMLLAVGALVGFEISSQPNKYSIKKMLTSEYLRAIAWIQVFTVAYTLVLSGALRSFDNDFAAVLALLPFYFLGFGAGIRILRKSNERKQLKRNWGRIMMFALPILVAEIIGALFFFLEFFALSDLDPTLVNLIVAAHVVPVFLMILGLRYMRKHMEANGIRRRWWLGIRFAVHKLPVFRHPKKSELMWLATSMSLLILSISYIT